MILFALILMAVMFLVTAAQFYDEWTLYRKHSLRGWGDKLSLLLWGSMYSVIMCVLGWAICQIMFGGFA